MLSLLSLLLLFVPLGIQIILGNKALAVKDLNKFTTICFFSLFSQFLLSFVTFFLVMRDITSHGGKCATPAAGMFALSFIFGLIVLAVMLTQYLIRKK